LRHGISHRQGAFFELDRSSTSALQASRKICGTMQAFPLSNHAAALHKRLVAKSVQLWSVGSLLFFPHEDAFQGSSSAACRNDM